MSWHITEGIQRAENQELAIMTFIHVFQNCNQDSCAVLAIMKDVTTAGPLLWDAALQAGAMEYLT